jgi:hypothetical protein
MVKNVLENNTNVFVEKKIAYMEKKKSEWWFGTDAASK